MQQGHASHSCVRYQMGAVLILGCLLSESCQCVCCATGRRGIAVRDIGLEAMTACLEDICGMVEAFCRSGAPVAMPVC